MKKLFDWIGRHERLKGFLADNRDMLIKVAAAGMLVVAAFVAYGFSGGSGEDAGTGEEAVSVKESEPQKAIICVDVGGEVRNPVVAELEEGSRVEDAIKAAGGVTENADLTDINRAAFVTDGDKILVPPLAVSEDVFSGEAMGGSAASPADGKININTADSIQLQELNGVGPATAEKIMAYREENGRFQAIEDIKNVSGIGEKTFEKFKDDIKI